MPAAPASAATALQADLTSILATNFVAYQALATEYRATSRQRLQHAGSWLAGVFQRNTRGRRLRALDIGCADGSHAYLLAEHGYDVTAVDVSPRMIRIARWRGLRFRLRKARRPRFLTGEFHAGTFRDSAGRTEQLGDHQFDLGVANAFVHLFPQPYDLAVVRKALELVAFEGTALFSTTIEESREEGYFVKYRCDGTGVDRWRGHYPKDEFLALVRDAAGEPFDVDDQITTDMRGRPWFTVAVRRARVG